MVHAVVVEVALDRPLLVEALPDHPLLVSLKEALVVFQMKKPLEKSLASLIN
jgi:hypothetical protein